LDAGLSTSHRDPAEPVAALAVDPGFVDFGVLAKGEAAERTVVVRNVGDMWLDVDLVVVGDGSFAVDGAVPMLAPGEEAAVSVAFSPTEPFAHVGALRAVADIPGGPVATADLTGEGAAPSVDLTVEAPPDAVVGCDPTSGAVAVRNVGGHDLTIDAVDPIAGAPAMLLTPDPVPLVLAPGASLSWPVSFRPSVVGAVDGVWVIRSNDPELDAAVASVQASGVYGAEQRVDRFTVEERALSVLVAFDRSESMGNDLETLQPAMERLIDEMGTVVPDFRVGVVTGVSSCANEGVLTPDTPELHEAFVRAMLGAGSPLTEALLQLAADAAEAECNADLWIPGEPVQVVVVSDEPEQSGDWEAQVDRIVAVVGDPWLVHVSGIVDVDGVCGEGAAGYVEAADETSGVLLDLCAADIADHVLDLLVVHDFGVDTFALSEPPVEASLEVLVDGLPWTAIYDAAVQSVRLVPAPPAGASVEVRWYAATCPA
jgi:hypothetical protein